MIDQLPPELLAEVVSYIATEDNLANVSLTCRALHDFMERDGWRTFTRNEYPYNPLPLNFSDWRNAAHGFTTLSRNLRRRAFIATCPEPSKHITSLPAGGVQTSWRRPGGQTMGFQPIIDSYSIFTGGSWRSQAEIVAWGAGAELILRRQERGNKVAKEWRKSTRDDRSTLFDENRNVQEWLTYRRPHLREGYDDITSVNLATPGQILPTAERVETVFLGRASGELAMLELSRKSRSGVVKRFETSQDPVRSAALMDKHNPLLAACLGDRCIALFSTEKGDGITLPISQVQNTMSEDRSSTRTWSTAFVSDKNLAVGRGPSHHMVTVYGMRPDGLTNSPVRTFGSGSATSTSVYTIAPLPTSSSTGASSPDLFLSGAYDGVIRLHDLRAPDDCGLTINDPIDHSPIFSLLTIGRERAVAGGGVNNLLKFFDLRRSDRRESICPTVDSPWRPLSYKADPCDGWNLFGQEQNNARNATSSPVYSLSRPSPWSTTIYAGMESSVLQLNFTAAYDNHPDPVYRGQIHKLKSGMMSASKNWDPSGSSVRNLTMYEQTGAGRFVLLSQHGLHTHPEETNESFYKQYDLRWRHPKYASTKVPHRPSRRSLNHNNEVTRQR